MLSCTENIPLHLVACTKSAWILTVCVSGIRIHQILYLEYRPWNRPRFGNFKWKLFLFQHFGLQNVCLVSKFLTICRLKKTYLNLILIKTLHMIFVCLKNLGSGSIKRKSLIRINMSRIRLYAHAESLPGASIRDGKAHELGTRNLCLSPSPRNMFHQCVSRHVPPFFEASLSFCSQASSLFLCAIILLCVCKICFNALFYHQCLCPIRIEDGGYCPIRIEDGGYCPMRMEDGGYCVHWEFCMGVTWWPCRYWADDLQHRLNHQVVGHQEVYRAQGIIDKIRKEKKFFQVIFPQEQIMFQSVQWYCYVP